jgi:hypothetical protein
VKARELLEGLRGRGVILEADGERLLVDAPPGVVTDEAREELAEHKGRLLALLRWEKAAGASGTQKDLQVADDGRRFDARPSRHPGYTSLYDPVEGEWHDFPTRDCYPSVVNLARRRGRREKKGGAA